MKKKHKDCAVNIQAGTEGTEHELHTGAESLLLQTRHSAQKAAAEEIKLTPKAFKILGLVPKALSTACDV